MMDYSSSTQDYELVTPAGYLIKIKPSRMHYIVFRENRPEIPTGHPSMEQDIPRIGFIGTQFEMAVKTGQIILVANQAGRILIPYRLKGEGKGRQIALTTPSSSDQLPIRVQMFDSVKQFLSKTGAQEPYRYMVVDSGVPRVELVSLKLNNPEIQVLAVHTDHAVGEKEMDSDRIRATDLVKNEKAGELAGNSVFLARLYLRGLELERVRELLLHKVISESENQFIRTFLQLMIRNEQKKAELESVKDRLIVLDEMYRFDALLQKNDVQAIQAELDQGVTPALAREYIPLLARKQSKTTQKAQEIQGWEWEYRLKKMAGETH